LDENAIWSDVWKWGSVRLDVVEFYSICKACNADPKKLLQSLMRKFEEIQTAAGK
jgi:hypothetical protein